MVIEGDVDRGLFHRGLMNNEVLRRVSVWSVLDKPKELFEVHQILAIDLRPHMDPGDDDLIEDNTPSDLRPQPEVDADLGDVDGSFEGGLAALCNADPVRYSDEGQKIKCDILNGQPGIHCDDCTQRC